MPWNFLNNLSETKFINGGLVVAFIVAAAVMILLICKFIKTINDMSKRHSESDKLYFNHSTEDRREMTKAINDLTTFVQKTNSLIEVTWMQFQKEVSNKKKRK